MDNTQTTNKTQKTVIPRFKDVSRFTRFISLMDDNDRQLDPKKRKLKWTVVLSGIFLIYLSSFLLPPPELSHPKLEPREPSLEETSPLSAAPDSSLQKSLTFEMPVDSFENLLKLRIHEGKLKKK